MFWESPKLTKLYPIVNPNTLVNIDETSILDQYIRLDCIDNELEKKVLW